MSGEVGERTWRIAGTSGTDDGWIIRRAEEAAVAICASKLTGVAEEFCEWTKQVKQAGQLENGNAVPYAKTGHPIRMCDHVQQITLDCLQHKTKCQAGRRPLKG